MSRLFCKTVVWRNVSSWSLSLRQRSCQQQQNRLFFRGSLLWGDGFLLPPLESTGVPLSIADDDDLDEKNMRLRPLGLPLYQQVRWKRNDGNRFYMKPRPPTKKERQEYNRRVKNKQEELERHDQHGSKAGIWRQLDREVQEKIWEPIPEPPTAAEREEYGIDDAVVDSLMKDTNCEPTPVPHHLGHLQRKLFNQVADKMEDFRRKVDSGESASRTAELPSDRDISLALRAFRDRYGTRQQPVGLAKALNHLLQDLGVPITSFGTLTYTALMTCSRTPKEARRVMELMKQQGQPICQYIWAILVDVYAHVGDYEACVAVHEEMAAAGLSPVLASYTSLFAACNRICTDGRIAHKHRAKAADVAWEKWMEMFSVGIVPDAMAYGAILRILASKGLPERAMGVLEEMRIMKVRPTTLCFTSALRAVARSHEVAIRFEKGASQRALRREEITAHHGKMAQEILILAQQAGVEQDEGFVEAMISCAAAAGDVATAKAIYVASQIRKLHQFRTTGADDYEGHLEGQEGRQDSMLSLTAADSEKELAFSESQKYSRKINHKSPLEAFEEREYGKDSRVLSAVARACATAGSRTHLGTMWQGRENQGYLCINSLRLLKTPGVPQYQDLKIPGEHRSDYWRNESDQLELDNEKNWGRKHGRRHQGVVGMDDDPIVTTNDLSPDMAEMLLEPDGSKKKDYRLTTFDDVWKMKYGEHDKMYREVKESKGYVLEDVPENPALPFPDNYGEKSQGAGTQAGDVGYWNDRVSQVIAPAMASPASSSTRSSSLSSGSSLSELKATSANTPETEKDTSGGKEQEELFFNDDTQKWETRLKADAGAHKSASSKKVIDGATSLQEDKQEETELYFDDEEMKWKTRIRQSIVARVDHQSLLENKNASADITKRTQLRASQSLDTDESWNLGEKDPFVREEELSEMDFELFYSELKNEIVESGISMNEVEEAEARELYAILKARHESGGPSNDKSNLEAGLHQSPVKAGVGTIELSPFDLHQISPESHIDKEQDDTLIEYQAVEEGMANLSVESPKHSDDKVDNRNVSSESELEELRKFLPMFSDQRLKRILKVFHQELGDPSLIDLVLAVRERMPDYITRKWLIQMSRLTSRYIMAEADRKGVVDTKFLNSMLYLKASLGGLQGAIHFHQTEFKERKLEPTQFSDRLILQMFLAENRFKRAMEFKRKLESQSRIIDLASYGSLVDYCAKRNELGSSLMLVRECIRVHGTRPNESMLKKLRMLLNQTGLEDDQEVFQMIGRDPNYFIKKGVTQQWKYAKMSKRRTHAVKKVQDLAT